MKQIKKDSNNSKIIETHDKESIKELFSNIKDLFGLIFEYRLATRALSLMLILALLMPLVFLGNFNSVSAQGNSSSSSTAPISAPPIAYKFSGQVASQFVSPAAIISNSFSSVAGYFSAPNLPKGFEIANASSPFYQDASSAVSSIGSVLGFVVPPIASENSSNLLADGAFPAGAVPFDFDNDNYADVSRWNSATGEWKVKDNQGNLTTDTLGTSASVIVPGDFDGDGKTDKAVFDVGTWTIRKSDGTGDISHSFGTTGDIPVTGDYDNDGKSDYAIFRPSTNTWWIQSINTGTITSTTFGATGDVPVQGDYDGDGETDIAIYRPSTGAWHISASTAGYYSLNWGLSSDTPIPADFNSDNKTDFGIFRPSTGTWYIYYSDFTTPYTSEVWGNYGDQPVAADYDGDGKADLSVWRPKTGVWLIKKSSDNTYKYETLGMNGDVPVPAAYIKKVGGNVSEYDFAKLRLEPINSTGGTDLYSRNFSWGTGLVGLSGRSGLGAGFGISYNSLVWLKDQNTITFDPDYSNVTPGFNFGYSRIEPVYWDKNNGRFAYIMVAPSGARVEFQQIAATDTYETADSSYVQLKVNNNGNPNTPIENLTITVTGTDGTAMEYEWKAGAYRAKEIKDTNGNYITINHDDYGLLKTVTDTLGRVITVNYDAELYPTTITQEWKTTNGSGSTTTHTYATFSYTNKTITTSFDSSLTVFGPPNGTSIKVLDKITSASGAYTEFEYNDYGQIWKINNHAIDGHKLNHTSVNLDNPTANQTDVPRFSETRSWVENFNLDTNGNEQEIAIQNTFQTGQSYSTPAGSGTGTLIQVSMTNHPHNNISKTYVGDSEWMESLPIVTEDWTDENSTLTRKRWSWSNWTQDDTSLSYINNPRTTESKVGDDENNYIRRTTTDYRLLPNTTIAEYGLVDNVKIYDADQTTILKQVETDYNFSNDYISKRIIGLPIETRAYGREGGALPMVSKVTYAYDEGDFSDSTLEQTITATQHDSTNYGATFIIGRGNLTSTTRHDPIGSLSSVMLHIKYNTAGSPVAAIYPDPNNSNGRVIKTSYLDNFNDSPSNKGTYAYPTKVTTPSANNSGDIFSEVKYRYDTGANVWAESPGPNGNGTGKETTREYDSLGRVEKQTLVNTGGYTRYEYPNSMTHSKIYSTVIDVTGNGIDSTDEVLAESWTDGAGRALKSRTEHPNSTGGYSGGFVEYNILGQVTRSTTPTEIDSSWTAVGDDASNGFLWTSQEYDWNGRTIRQVNTDGTDRLMSYNGCGCAGGQVTTIQSELVPRDDIPTQNARRTQKIYSDILGRNYKTEILKWDGTTLYTTTSKTYNGRDQVTQTRQYEGDTNSSTYQDVTMTYDGLGRMKTRNYPIEDSGADTTWNYNIDDSIYQVIDPRGTITEFTYNNLGLITDIEYTPPANPPTNVVIPDTPDITFTYNNVGQRTQMADGTGTTDYVYDDLSRLTSESKYFTDLPNAPVANNKYTIAYTYNLSGGLKSVTDPFGVAVDYTHDKIGRLTKVKGDALTNNPTGDYADNIKYRAFGQIKQIDYKMASGTTQIKMEYDDRLRVNNFDSSAISGTTGLTMEADYTYFNDSRTEGKDDLVDDKFDTSNKYDFAGRLVFNQYGMATNHDNQQVRLYEQNIGYDSFSRLKTRSGKHWGQTIGFTGNTYDVNGRLQNQSGITYDASGNIVRTGSTISPHDFQETDLDAAGRRVKHFSSSKGRIGNQLNMIRESQTEHHFDGDGRPVKEEFGHQNYHVNDPQPTLQIDVKGYQVWSTVLGSAFTSIEPDGTKKGTKVFAGGAIIASHGTDDAGWITADPVTGKMKGYSHFTKENYNKEREPLGQEVLDYDPTDDDEVNGPPPNETLNGWQDMQWQCKLDGVLYDNDFFAMPNHCQQALLNNANVISFESPANITDDNPFGIDSPIKKQVVPDGNMPTEKPKQNDNLADDFIPSAIPKASIPDDDEVEYESGEIIINENGKKWDGSIPGLKDASKSGDDFKYKERWMTYTDINTLRTYLQDITSDPQCFKFVSNTLKYLQKNHSSKVGFKTTDIWEVFEKIFTNKNNYLFWMNEVEYEAKTGKSVGAWGTFRFRNMPRRGVVRRLGFDESHFLVSNNIFGSSKMTHSSMTSMVGTLVHEIIHAYAHGNRPNMDPISHKDMDDAGQSVANAILKTKDNDKSFSQNFYNLCYRGFNGIRKQ